MKSLKYVILALIGLSLQACAAADSAKYAKGQGMTQVYAASYDDTWDASIAAVDVTSGTIVEQDKTAGSIVAKYGVTAFSWGERVAVFLKSLGKNQTEVEVVSKRAVGVNVTAANWEDDIHENISKTLK